MYLAGSYQDIVEDVLNVQAGGCLVGEQGEQIDPEEAGLPKQPLLFKSDVGEPLCPNTAR